MGRHVHAEAMRERQNMRANDSGTTLGGTSFRHECRICGANHGAERHGTCPECGQTPLDFNARIQEHVTWDEHRKVPFDAGSSWASTRVEIGE